MADDVADIAKRYASKMQVRPQALRIWGSCGHSGTLRFDWRLIFAPKTVLEYVVLHELCHLKERSHSPAFWSVLHAQMPDYGQRKTWLEQHQHLLDALPA